MSRIPRLLRALGAFVCLLLGVPLIILSGLTIQVESTPVRKLNESDLAFLAKAAKHVNDHRSTTGSYPGPEEFRAWARESAGPLPLPWASFGYNPPVGASSDYSFTFWDGDFNYTWNAVPGNSTKAFIDPAAFFLFGSKRNDLFAFIGIASLLLMASYLLVRPLWLHAHAERRRRLAPP